MKIRIVTALAAAAVVTAGAGVSARPAQALELGFIDPSYQVENPTQFWSDAAVLKPKVLRYNVIWEDIAKTRPANPRNPSDPAYNWVFLDSVLRGAVEHKVTPILTFWRTPRWAAAKPSYRKYSFNALPSPKAFQDFVAATAQRYSGRFVEPGAATPLPRVARWETWNEPNMYLYPDKVGKRLTIGRDFTRLNNLAYAEIKRANRTNVVAAGAMTNTKKDSAAAKAPVNFLAMMKANRARFDVISFHPYPRVPGLGLREFAGKKGPNVGVGNFSVLIKTIDRLWPGKRYKIWLTEFGWQTTPDIIGVTPRTQAAYLRQSVLLFRKSYRRVTTLVWFLIRDEPLLRPDCLRCQTWQSGLRYAKGAKKPSFRTWINLAR